MAYPLVSIIVPVYNAEKYLSDCIESILSQSYKNFELILVNDGSTDCSAAVCRKYARQNKQIILVDRANGGGSSARNEGISKACGEWITFIDSDDYVSHDYIEHLVNLIGEDIDLIQSGLIYFNTCKADETYLEILPDKLCLRADNPDECFTLATMPLITSPVSKLYRRHILLTHNVRFDVAITVGEDRDFNLSYLNRINRSCTTGYAGYYYRKGITGNLSSNTDYIRLLNWDIAYLRKLKAFFECRNCESAALERYLAHRLFNIYNDRLVQYFNSNNVEHAHTRDFLKTIVSQRDFSWLCKHFDLVDCNGLVSKIYLSKSPLLLLWYYRLLRILY